MKGKYISGSVESNTFLYEKGLLRFVIDTYILRRENNLVGIRWLGPDLMSTRGCDIGGGYKGGTASLLLTLVHTRPGNAAHPPRMHLMVFTGTPLRLWRT